MPVSPSLFHRFRIGVITSAVQSEEKGEPSHLLPVPSPAQAQHNCLTQKCDAQRPCASCVETDSVLECEYQVVTTHNTQFTFLIEPCPSSSTDPTPQEHWAVANLAQDAPPEQPVVTTNTGSILKLAPPACALIRSFGRNSRPPLSPLESPPHILNQVPTRNSTLPHFSVLNSLVFPTIPQEPHVTFSFLCPERFQLSDPVKGELDMKLYVYRVPSNRCQANTLFQPAPCHMQAHKTWNTLHLRETASLVAR